MTARRLRCGLPRVLTAFALGAGLALLWSTCSEPAPAQWTGLRVTLDLHAVPPVDQLAFSVSLDGSPLVDGVRRPERPDGPLSPDGESVVIRFDDVQAGRLARVQVQGLLAGEVVAAGDATKVLERGRILPLLLVLSAVERCGDGHLGPAEQCDDGNDAAGDGCDASCAVEPGWECTGAPSSCSLLPGCEGDADCPGSLCDRFEGHCVGEHNLVHVDCNAPCPGTGDQNAPFCSLAMALAQARPEQSFWIHGSTCDGPFELQVSDVQIVGEGGTVLQAPSCPVLRVTGAAVQVRGVTVAPDGAQGGGVVAEQGATLDLEWSRVLGGSCLGVECLESECHLWWNEVRDNAGGGVRLLRSDFELVNNLIAGNGTNRSQVGGVFIDAGGAIPAVLAFNTIADNRSSGGGAGCGGVCCSTVAQVERSILWGNSGKQVTAACTTRSSVVDEVTLDGVDGCVAADPLLDATYHLQQGSPAIDPAGDQPGAIPPYDLDGTPRPHGAGADWGADEFEAR